MITEIEGNVFESPDDILIHGCNCFCVMGAGVARMVRQLYPLSYNADQKTISGAPFKLGTYSYSTQKHNYYPQNLIVINAYTQFRYSSKSSLYDLIADYDAIRTVMTSINKDFPKKSISMPRIGAGLGGGDWNEISDIINSVFRTRNITVYNLKGK